MVNADEFPTLSWPKVSGLTGRKALFSLASSFIVIVDFLYVEQVRQVGQTNGTERDDWRSEVKCEWNDGMDGAGRNVEQNK